MPALGSGNRSAAVERTLRKKRRRRPKPKPTPAPAGSPFGPGLPTDGLTRAQGEAKRKTVRARRALPPLALPHIPIIRNPTPAQTRAARRSVIEARNRIVGDAGSPQERRDRYRQVNEEFLADPRMRRVILHYGKAAERQTALAFARAYGVRGSKRHRVQAGRRLLSARRQRAMQDTVRPGPEHTRIGIPGVPAASIDWTSLSRAIIGQTSFKYGTPDSARRFVAAGLGDVKSLVTGPFVAGYELGASGWEALHGDTSRGQRLAKGVLEGLKGSVPGQLVQGDVEGALESFREHPVFGLLDLSAAGAVVGRTGGAVARGLGSTPEAPGIRGGLARAGSTVRSPIALIDDAGAVREGRGVVSRRGSKDLIRAGLQRARDAEREPVRDAQGNVVTVTERGRTVPVLKATPRERARELKRQADFDASRANAVERLVREQAGREMKVRGVRGRTAKDLVAMVVEGTITTARHFEQDLRAHAERLRAEIKARTEGEPGYRHTEEYRAARDRLALVEKVLASPKALAQADKIVAAGEVVGRKLNEFEREAIALGLLDPRQARRSGLVPAAIEHLGARYFREPELRALERSGVDVREPRALEAHRAAVAARDTARTAYRDAAKKVEQLAQARARLVGAQSSRRGRRQAEARGGGLKVERGARPEGRATRAEQRKLERLTGELSAARRAARDARRDMRKAERKLGRTPKPPIREALRGPDGRFLSNDEIMQFLRDRGRDPDTVAYLPHRVDVRGRRAFHTQFRPGSRGTLDKGEVRTGEAYRKGATESSAQLILEQGVRLRTQIAKARQLDRSIASLGMRRPDGQYWTAKEAAETAERVAADTGERLVAVRAFPAKLDAETQRIIRDHLQGPGAMESLSLRLLNDRIVHGDTGGARNVVLMPEKYIKRLEKHLAPAGDIEKFLQALNRPFRFAVLAQPRWIVGNFVEPFIVRLTTTGAGVNVFGLGVDIAAANRMMRRMRRSPDPRVRQAAVELEAQQRGGLFIGGRGASNRRSLEEFEWYAELVKRIPAVQQAGDMVSLVGRVLMAPAGAFFRVNRMIEHAAQSAALGRDIRRDLQEFRGSWLQTIRLQADALDDVAKGLVNSATQRRFMREQHELLGRYEGYPPWMRRLIQTAFPFVPWALNSVRFTLWTVPAHRTIQTALLLKVNDVVAKDWEEIHANTPPGGLRLAIPTKKGGWIDLVRYTPWGLTGVVAEGMESPGAAAQPIIDQAFPLFSGPYAALQGDDPFGRELALDPSENAGESAPNFGQAAGIAGYGLAEALLPYVSQVRRLREGGGTAYAGSTIFDPDVKPGTSHMSAARRTIDPFRPTYLRAPATIAPSGGGAATPRDRVQDILERRAALLESDARAQDGLQDLLERRARLLGGP